MPFSFIIICTWAIVLAMCLAQSGHFAPSGLFAFLCLIGSAKTVTLSSSLSLTGSSVSRSIGSEDYAGYFSLNNLVISPNSSFIIALFSVYISSFSYALKASGSNPPDMAVFDFLNNRPELARAHPEARDGSMTAKPRVRIIHDVYV